MSTGISFHIILGNILFTAIAMIALLVGGWTSVAALSVCGAYYLLSTVAMLLTATGGMRDVLIVWVERSARIVEIIVLMAWQRRSALPVEYDVNLEADSSGHGFSLPITSSYVPAVAGAGEAAKLEARAWVAGLFDERQGTLDAHKVHLINSSEGRGWLKVRAPVGAPREILLKRGVLLRRRNGFALNLDLITTFEDADELLR